MIRVAAGGWTSRRYCLPRAPCARGPTVAPSTVPTSRRARDAPA